MRRKDESRGGPGGRTNFGPNDVLQTAHCPHRARRGPRHRCPRRERAGCTESRRAERRGHRRLPPGLLLGPVAGADKYNFVLSADSAFNSPVYQVNGTKNTRSTPDKTVPNGTHDWRVQAVDTDGNTSGWSETRQIEKLWADSPVLTAPDDAATISFPDEPLVPGRRWFPRRGEVPHLHCLRSGPRLPRD